MADIIALPYGLLTAVTYLIVLDGQCVLIDPTAPPDRLPAGLPPVRHILATHGHFDHIAQADAWRDLTGAGLSIHTADSDCLTDAKRNLSLWLGDERVFRPADILFNGQESLRLDSQCRLDVWHTPGHTAGSCCLLLREGGRPVALFSGDTLFAGSVGRTDLGGDARLLQASLRQLVAWCEKNGFTQQDDLPVYPGHGTKTGLFQEQQQNPFLRNLS